MSEKDFPKEVTKDNIDELKAKAIEIKKKAKQWRYRVGYVASYSILGSIALLLLLHIANWLVSTYLPDSPPLVIVVFFPAVLVVWAYLALGVILDIVSYVQRRNFGYPRYEEEFFAKCLIIATYVKDNEREKAMKEVEGFLSFLNAFVRDRFNPKRKVYSPEINLIIDAETEFCRMLMFSKDEIPELLMNLGLAVVRGDNPNTFYHINQLLGNIQEYEYRKQRGKIRKFIAEMELIKFLFSIIVFVVPLLLAILGIIPNM